MNTITKYVIYNTETHDILIYDKERFITWGSKTGAIFWLKYGEKRERVILVGPDDLITMTGLDISEPLRRMNIKTIKKIPVDLHVDENNIIVNKNFNELEIDFIDPIPIKI